MSCPCDNPDCDHALGSASGRSTHFAKRTFYSTKCKEEFFLWVLEVAYLEPKIEFASSVRRPYDSEEYGRPRGVRDPLTSTKLRSLQQASPAGDHGLFALADGVIDCN